jgi:hypothetical protein
MTKRKKGAQPGNTNAVKYGFYTRRLPARDVDGLDQTPATSLKDEIEVMRIFSRKVAELGADVDNLDEAKDLLRVLSLSTSSINRLVRTNSLMPELTQNELLKQALSELEQEWPEFKQLCDSYRGDNPGNPPSSL